jgi:proteasome lid subunit RPN8/RPN11
MSGNQWKIWISAEVAQEIRAHGAETYPEECCGALLGRDATEEGPREILGSLPLLNRREDSPHIECGMERSTRRNRYEVSPQDVMQADKVAAERGLDVIGWYHSHPDHPARPSEYDRENAWPWYSYIIVSVQNGVAREMTSWRLKENREQFLEEQIEEEK